jgi:tetratricopeptide (TPR) repeat protein
MRSHGATETDVQRIAESSLATLTRSRHDRGQAHAARLLSLVHLVRCEWQRAEETLWIALRHAQAAGDRREQVTIAGWLAAALYHGPTRTDLAVPRYESLLDDFAADPLARARIECHLAVIRAMQGELQEARDLAHRSCSALDNVGSRVLAASARLVTSEVEALAGDGDSAIRTLMEAHEVLQRAGERAVSLEAAAELAGRLCDEGRHAEAEEWMAPRRNGLEGADVMVRSVGLAVEAKLAEHRSEPEQAVSFASSAVATVAATDAVNRHASALVTLSTVLAHAGREDEARRARDEACALFEAKGNRVAADQTRAEIPTS